MHWVYENQMAFDNAELGFPSILGCQAICFHTTRGLYGFHDMKSGTQTAGGMTSAQVSDAKLAIFAKWVTDAFQTGETGNWTLHRSRIIPHQPVVLPVKRYRSLA